MSAPEPILHLDRMTLTARIGGAAVEVLRDICLAVPGGRIVGLVGESGAGKSMIGKVIAGLQPPGFDVTGGQVLFRGRPLPGSRGDLLGRDIAFIPQDPLSALNPVLTIGQQFDEHLARLGTARAARRSAMLSALGRVGLVDPQALCRRYPHQLSGGQCQRVLIALAFASRPGLVVADEPTSALDVVSQALIMRVLAGEQRSYGTAVLLITHDLRLAAHVCDEVAVMYAGEVVEQGPADAVLRRPLHPYTRGLRDAMPPLHGPRRALPAIGEFMPGLQALAQISGCRYAARCPVRSPECVRSRLALRERAPRQFVRCGVACSETVQAGVSDAGGGAHGGPTGRPDWDGGRTSGPDRNGGPKSGADGNGGRTSGADGNGVFTSGPHQAVPLLEFRDVDLCYESPRGLLGRRRGAVQAVRAASFRVDPGESVGIVGESGSGKSSIARLALGLELPTAGRVLVDGADLHLGAGRTSAGAPSGLRIVFQDPQSALNPRRRVARLVTQIMEAPDHRRPLPDRLARALELLQQTGLPADCMSRYPSQLSGGQRQRVNIARALCVTPRLLVADEIVSGLDVSVQSQILNLLDRLRRSLGLALLFISHDLSVVRYLCERVLVMHRGRIVESASTEDVFLRPREPYTRMLIGALPPEDPDQQWPPAADAIAADAVAAAAAPAG